MVSPFFMSLPKLGQNIELDIQSLSYGLGHGVAKKQGFVFFVADTVPGDLILAKIIKVKKTYAEAKLIQVLKPSNERRIPPCPYTNCGGCQWQQVSYQEQVKQKKNLVEQNFKSFHLHPSTINFYSSPNEFRYRNRIQIQINNNSWGFHKKSSHQFIAVDDCLIADKKLVARINQDITKLDNGRLQFALNSTNSVQISKKKSYNSDLFSQVNASVNELITQQVIDVVSKINPQLIVDAYCGSGNFSFSLASQINQKLKIWGIEWSQASVKLAKQKAKQKPFLSELIFFAGKVEDQLKILKDRLSTIPDKLIILDPPRDGCDSKVISSLLNEPFDSILYLSCKMSTQKRDLEKLKQKYEIQWINGFDMFPQTPHIETLVYLKLKSN